MMSDFTIIIEREQNCWQENLDIFMASDISHIHYDNRATCSTH